MELAEGLRLYVRLERDCWCGIGIVALCEGLAPEAADAAFCEAFRRTAGAAFDCPWPAEGDWPDPSGELRATRPAAGGAHPPAAVDRSPPSGDHSTVT